MRSDFIDRYFIADQAQAKHRKAPERYSLGFSVLVILTVTLLGWAAIGYATLLLIEQIRSFSL
jgi:hypothetical protein